MSDEAKTPVPFLDWFELWPGASGYEADGRAFIGEFPTGVKLTVQPPREKRDFEMAEDRPWEGGRLNISTLMHHAGRFRLWYHTQPRGWSGSATCYAESDDGVAWEKPALGLCEFEGSRENNIIDSDLEGHIFVDTNPQAPEAERYKMVGMQGWWKRGGGHMEGAEDEPDALKLRTELCAQGRSEQEIMEEIGLMGNLMGAVSPDGLRWTLLDRPLLEMFCDSDNIVFFDEERKAYVGYFRHNMFRETVPTVWPPNPWRCIGRAETGDFRHWPTPTIVVQPEADDPPTQDVYTNAYAPYPTGKYHIMFPSIYHRGTDVVDTQIAVSRNGITWFRHKDPILRQGPPERNEDGGIYVRHGIFPLDQSHWGGSLYLHEPPPQRRLLLRFLRPQCLPPLGCLAARPLRRPGGGGPGTGDPPAPGLRWRAAPAQLQDRTGRLGAGGIRGTHALAAGEDQAHSGFRLRGLRPGAGRQPGGRSELQRQP